MNITPTKLERYRRFAREREVVRQEQLAARRQQAWDLARQAADLLRQEFGATRVVLFGSLLHPELFHPRSDIDLVVWDVKHYYRAVAWLLDLNANISIDLIPVEDARPHILELIESEGVDL